MVEEKINILSELLNGLSAGKKSYAFNIVNKIVDRCNYYELQCERMKAKKIGVTHDNYDTMIERCVDILEIIGIDKIDLFELDKEALEFIKRHKHKIKKPLTGEYIKRLNNLFRYSQFANNKTPKNLIDLKDAYSEIESNRD